MKGLRARLPKDVDAQRWAARPLTRPSRHRPIQAASMAAKTKAGRGVAGPGLWEGALQRVQRHVPLF